MLPNIKFNISTGGLGRLQADIQKIPGLVITGKSVSTKVTIGNSYQLFSIQEAESLGIDKTSNPFAHKHIKRFYDYAGEGAELWIMLVSDATTMAQMVDKSGVIAAKLIQDAGGKIRVLGIIKESTGTETSTNGLDADVDAAVIASQDLADYFAEKYYPFRIIISGNNFTGSATDLKDYSTTAYNRVSVLLSNTDGGKEAGIGLALARLASIPVQRNIGRVKDGPVEDIQAYFTSGVKVESNSTFWETMHSKSYIILRNYVGRAGFFFSDDPTCTKVEDDFKSLANGFVMDKAILIAYNTLVNELLDEVPVTKAGTIHPAIIKNWQANVKSQLSGLMIATGELSGCDVFIDDKQNILTTGILNIRMALQPVGYAKYIIVNIGFTTNIE
ncbi:DUF2586 family protein [Chryseobacterium indologenes]|uniref:DUF2586 family protein n=1 Tax=Chryseobacterium indologenes TaxID=253 RepID=UPI001D0D1B05|nr:DUF2586 family protein [Chryseobacterium indologenes]UDQ54997.1 DUF2586 family protein [Chryseobacterium indologenes]